MALVANPATSLIFSKIGQPGDTRVPTIGDLSETLKRVGLGEIPLSLELCDEDFPTLDIVHDDSDDTNCQVPLIDFSLLQTDRGKLIKQLGDAAIRWGSCQIINHGITLESMQQLVAEGYKYFELPAERKQQTKSFVGDNTLYKLSSLYWAESWMIYCTGRRAELDAKVLSAWPEGNNAFRDVTAAYIDQLQLLTKQLFQLYAEDLGLESDVYSQHVDTSELTIRWNYYPACPHPSNILGAKSHTDMNMFTVLLQDEVGGLQVERDGRWFGVKPVDGALVLIISDGFHLLTNGIYKPVLHRVLVNRNTPRISLAGLWSPDDTTMYTAPDELIDENQPRLYKPVKAGEYKQHAIEVRSTADMGASQREHSKLLGGYQLKKWKIDS